MQRLLKLFEQGYISPEVYFQKREEYEEQLLKMYLEGKITLDQLCEKLDK